MSTKGLKSRRPSPAEVLSIATQTAPEQPPALVSDPTLATVQSASDRPTTLNLRMRRSTVAALEAAARGKGLTMKQVVAQALQASGVAVADADMEDRTPRRR